MSRNPTVDWTRAQARQGASEGSRRIRLASASGPSAKLAAFDQLAHELRARYGPVDGHALHDLWAALEHARRDLAARGTVSEAQSRQLKDCIARDLDHFGALLARGPLDAQENLRRRSAKAAPGTALRALLEVLDKAGEATFAMPPETPAGAERRAGEVTCAGRLTCTHCRASAVSEGSTIVEPCRACGGRAFIRSP